MEEKQSSVDNAPLAVDENKCTLESPTEEEKHLIRIARRISGPLPSAEEFQGYEMAVPGAGERILAMAERQSEHRQKREMRELDIISRDSRYGLIFAFVFSISALLGAFVLSYTDHTVSGCILGSTGLVTVVGAFIHGRATYGTGGPKDEG